MTLKPPRLSFIQSFSSSRLTKLSTGSHPHSNLCSPTQHFLLHSPQRTSLPRSTSSSPTSSSSQPSSNSSATPRTILLLFSLSTLIPSPSSPSKDPSDLFPRLHTHLKSTPHPNQQPLYIIYTTPQTSQTEITDLLHRHKIPQPDALITGSGQQIYQKGYRTPDPLWESQTGDVKDWEKQTGKIVRWGLEKLEGVEVVEGGEEGVVVVREKDGCSEGAGLVERVRKILKDVMGVESRDVLRVEDVGGRVEIGRKVVGVNKAVEFCQKMLGVRGKDTCVFGDWDLVRECCANEDGDGDMGGEQGNLGVVVQCTGLNDGPERKDLEDSGSGARVVVAKAKGEKGCVEGLLHHGLL